jgi:stage III sporulation protein AH
MVLRKQTVWLLTMLAVMVVLSGYYLVKGPAEQVPVTEELQEDAIGDVQVDTKESAQPAPQTNPSEEDATTLETPSAQPADGDAAVLADTPSDVFQGYKMKRDALLQQQKDEQKAILMSPDATPQAAAEAKARYEELSTIEQATLTLEELLKASGYKDAVVSVQKDKVSVIVQKEKLSANEVVDIIAQVKQHLNVPGKNVSVQYKAL